MRTFPDDFDDEDRAYASALTPEGSFIGTMITVVSWMDSDGEEYWRCYNATNSVRAGQCVGLMEFAKPDMIARSETGLPIRYGADDDE